MLLILRDIHDKMDSSLVQHLFNVPHVNTLGSDHLDQEKTLKKLVKQILILEVSCDQLNHVEVE